MVRRDPAFARPRPGSGTGNGAGVTGKNVQVSSSGGTTTLWIDTNNTAGADVQINLTGTFNMCQLVAPSMIDEFPVLFVAAALAHGRTVTTGPKTSRLTISSSWRAPATTVGS